MKISTKGRYGLTMMMDLARHYGKGPLSLKAIATNHQLSEHYLEQLIVPLRHGGLIRSIRGAYGGYALLRPPEEVTAGDVIRLLEGPISPVEFTEEDDAAKRDLWMRIRDAIARELDQTTLASLISYSSIASEEDPYMFYI